MRRPVVEAPAHSPSVRATAVTTCQCPCRARTLRHDDEALMIAILRDGTDGFGFSSAEELREGERHPLFRWSRW